MTKRTLSIGFSGALAALTVSALTDATSMLKPRPRLSRLHPR